MIDVITWDALYRHKFDWVLSRITPDTLEFYHDDAKNWLEAVLAFDKFQRELFITYSVNYKSGDKFKRSCVKGIEITGSQLLELYQKHLSQYTNNTVRYFLFQWWTSLRKYLDDGEPSINPHDSYKPATKEEIERARKNFSHVKQKRWYDDKFSEHHHTFNDDAKVLEYRGHRFIIDNEWGDAWALDKKGEVRNFNLIYDWWYPIDEFLDLSNC